MKKKIIFTKVKNIPTELELFIGQTLIMEDDILWFQLPVPSVSGGPSFQEHSFNIYELEKEGIVTIEEITE